MSKTTKVNYRKIYQEFHGLSKEQMRGMDVHHVDGDRNNNDPSNLVLLTPEEHAAIHESEFVLWARFGQAKATESRLQREKTIGPTDSEIQHRKKMSELAKTGLHRIRHTEETKFVISENKKEFYKNKENHPRWGASKYLMISPTGEEFIIEAGIKQFCQDRGIHNLYSVISGKRTHCNGWKAVKLQ